MAEISSIFNKGEADEVLKVGQALQTTDDILTNFISDTERLITVLNEEGASLGALLSNYEKVKEKSKGLDKVEKQLIQSEEKLKQVQDKRTKTIIKNRVATQEETKQIKDKIKASKAERLTAEAQDGAYNKIAKALSSNIAKWKQMSSAERNKSKAGKKLLRIIQQQIAELKKLDTQIGRSQRNVGNYASALKGVAGNLVSAFGVGSGVYMFVNVLKNAFATIRTFTKENAKLAGVLGTTRDQVESLTEQAITLGSIYPTLASEVTQLQVSYAKLGFTQSEILSLTEATIVGSISLNASLDETATLVGAVVKAYDNLSTINAEDIINQLTTATQKSSLSFEGLQTGLPKVAAAANAMNVPLSKTLALLGVAQDATLDASISGTSLRNIFLELDNAGMSLNEALAKINSSQNSLSTAYQLFGKRAAIVALAIAKNKDKVDELTTEIEELQSASKTAAEQMNTLDGSKKKFSSSWEKVILSMRSSENWFSEQFDGMSNRMNAFTDEFATFSERLLLFSGNVGKAAEKRFKLISKIVTGLNLYPEESAIEETERNVAKRHELLKEIQSATAKEAISFINNNKAKAEAGDKYSKAIVEAAQNRIDTLVKLEEEERTREEAARQKRILETMATEEEITNLSKTERQKQIEQINAKYDELKARAEKYKLDTTEIESARAKEIRKIYSSMYDGIINSAKSAEKEMEDLSDEELDNTTDNLNKTVNETISAGNEILAEAKARIQATISERNRQYRQELLIIKATSSSEEEERERTLELNKSLIEESIAAYEKQLENTDLSAAQRIELEEKVKDKKLELNEIVAEDEEAKAEKREEQMKALANSLIDLGNSIYEADLAEIEAEMDALEEQHDQGLISDEEYEEKKAELEDEYNQKKKEQALTNAFINIAEGMTKALAQGGIFGIAMGAVVAAAGAYQIKQIQAQYAEGTDNATDNFIAGEEGRELMQLRTGEIIMVDEPTHFEGNKFKGATIKSNPETEKIMEKAAQSDKIFFDTADIKKGLGRVEKAIKNKPVLITDNQGTIIGKQSNKNREIYINRLKRGR